MTDFSHIIGRRFEDVFTQDSDEAPDEHPDFVMVTATHHYILRTITLDEACDWQNDYHTEFKTGDNGQVWILAPYCLECHTPLHGETGQLCADCDKAVTQWLQETWDDDTAQAHIL